MESTMADGTDQLFSQLETLRLEYERYFIGVEKRPPYRLRDRVSREIRRYDPGNQSVIKFKHRNLIQRLITLEQYWERTHRAIEAGTYSRDVARADFRDARRAGPQQPSPSQKNRTQAENAIAQSRAKEVGQAASSFLDQLKALETEGDLVEMRGRTRRRDGRESS